MEGRIDRLDLHQNLEEACCWDYKSGRLPGAAGIRDDRVEPQLPLYLMALKKNAGFSGISGKKLKAGYIGLRSEGELEFKEPLADPPEWETCLADWENELKVLGVKLREGKFLADPKPEPRGAEEGACSYCPYRPLCRYWKAESNLDG
jgi:ATP-dependent helicase/DNAse subunit B